MIISIDGPAGSGKSTVAELLSKKLGFIHFNSGSLFRGITVYLRKKNFDFKSITPESEIPSIKLKVSFDEEIMNVFVNNFDCTNELRDNEISFLTPIVSTNKNVRTIIDIFQRKFAKTHNIVVDGRDIGSHVFPNAEYKFYLDCSLEERAKRRFKEEKAKGNSISLEIIKNQIAERDEIDKHKKYAPLVIPDGAILVDSSNLTINQVLKKMLSCIKISKKP